jgi:hypothetical protein
VWEHNKRGSRHSEGLSATQPVVIYGNGHGGEGKIDDWTGPDSRRRNYY